MFAYLSIKSDMQRENDGGVGERARSTESLRQNAESVAWAAASKGVTPNGR